VIVEGGTSAEEGREGAAQAIEVEVEVEVDEVEERASMGGQGRPRRVQPAGPLGRS